MKKSTAVLYGSLTFFTTIIHNTFLLYHIDYNLSVVKVDLYLFWAIEMIFLVWNSVNDPIFGWISDKYLLNASESKSHSKESIRRRLQALSWAFPLLTISFLLFWIPTSASLSALQLLLALCLYDTGLTTIELHYNALMVDLATTTSDRADLNFYNSAFACVGASTVFISYSVWNPDDPGPFRLFCLAISIFALIGYLLVIPKLKKTLLSKKEDEDLNEESLARNKVDSQPDFTSNNTSPFQFLKQLSKNPNFFWFSSMNLIQVLHCHFNSSFFPMILDSLLQTNTKATLGAILLALSFIAPHFNNLFLAHLCKIYGTYGVVRTLFYLKLVFPILLLLCGIDCMGLLVVFVACNRIFTEGLCKVLNLVQSEIVDEDYVLSRRKHPVAALVSGTISLVTKPGQTLAPIIGTALISYLSTSTETVQTTAHASKSSQMAIFYTIIWVPIVCAGLQIAMWTQYKLKGSRLKMIQNIRNSRTGDISSSTFTYLPL